HLRLIYLPPPQRRPEVHQAFQHAMTLLPPYLAQPASHLRLIYLPPPQRRPEVHQAFQHAMTLLPPYLAQ
ncbi:hypothetical protein CKF46_37710, partial [Klebsiella pneumoniae]